MRERSQKDKSERVLSRFAPRPQRDLSVLCGLRFFLMTED
jgi:hypothetical protein